MTLPDRPALYPLVAGSVAFALLGVGIVSASEGWVSDGINPHPVTLMRPATAPLSLMAELGRQIFFDAALSSSGRLSCASCHDPAHAYGPSGDAAAAMGGPDLESQGVRAVPSLMYLEREPVFSIGPDDAEAEVAAPMPVAFSSAAAQAAKTATKTATDTAASAANLVPQGGLFWDGRADTLQDQALSPLLNPIEMDGGSVDRVAAKLRIAPYAPLFRRLFGAAIFADPRFAVSEALFAVGRFEIEDPSFHPYTSKFDYWLEGRARLGSAELRGYRLFNDPAKANCGGCHLDNPSPDGLPPRFTDAQFEALAVPRNAALAANRDPAYHDLGLCGPYRTDLAAQQQYCGFFLTPTLRNVAGRRTLFHNGVYHTLAAVLDFYDFRDVDPARVYPRASDGRVALYDDLPRQYWPNVDTTDPPFDRKQGDAPAMSAADERDIVAFLGTLSDGYQP